MRLALVLLAALLASCSKDEPPPPEPTEPWPATQQEEQPEGHLLKRYLVSSGTADFVVPAKEAKPRGRLRVAKGELDVDLLDLAATRGSVQVDLASVVMQGEDTDAGTDQDFTRAARNWLDTGSSKPDAERERLRWARFQITAIHDVSASAAHEGKRVAVKRVAVDAGDAGADAAPEMASTAELRQVDLAAVGELTVHNRKVERSVELRVTFRYPVAATPGAVPEHVRIETRRPMTVSLLAHDIRPRDAAGVLISTEMPLIGTKVGREARVSLDLQAKPAK